MTIEQNLERIAASLELIAASLSAKPVSVTTPVAAPVVEATPVVAPVTLTPITLPVAAPTAMPPTPVFTQAVAPTVAPVGVTVAAAPQAPAFADKAAMMDFVIASYKALGQEKGAKIQEVLTGMGFQNVNDVPSERWGELKSGIDSLKG